MIRGDGHLSQQLSTNNQRGCNLGKSHFSQSIDQTVLKLAENRTKATRLEGQEPTTALPDGPPLDFVECPVSLLRILKLLIRNLSGYAQFPQALFLDSGKWDSHL
jgi:hypothetical protein